MARFNEIFGVLFELNNIIKSQGTVLTQEQIDELTEQKAAIMAKLATVGSDAGMVFMTFSVFAGCDEADATLESVSLYSSTFYSRSRHAHQARTIRTAGVHDLGLATVLGISDRHLLQGGRGLRSRLL